MAMLMRSLGDLLPELAANVALTLGVGAAFAAAASLGSMPADPGTQRIAAAAAVLVVVLALVPARAWLRDAIAGAAFRRGRLQQSELQQFLHTLSPELGIAECCRRALAEVVRVMGLRGACAVLDGGLQVTVGEFRLGRLPEVWRVSDPAIPAQRFGGFQFWGLPQPVMDALIESDVIAVVRVASAHKRWGHVFVSTDLRGASLSSEDAAAVDRLADQVARLLDAAELLDRAIAVERSLAHAEKLAAIGETAARIAHEIRNPVTAARSLTQLLARHPDAPENPESVALILGELERVERMVASLLRFARREELALESVDLGRLARETGEHFRPRLDGAGVLLEVETPTDVRARADREKVRQVLINLIDNAVDALAASPSPRIRLSVTSADDAARLEISDNGPGVAAETLPRLFEPFFSLKANGTGLGLAIVKRTVEAHGGAVTAISGDGEGRAGLTLRIDLPLDLNATSGDAAATGEAA
jgi:signal transduction histidine kinase